MNHQLNSNAQNKNNSSALREVFKHGGEISVLLTILAMLGMGIGAIALMGDAPATYENIIEFSPNGLRLENRIKKGEVER